MPSLKHVRIIIIFNIQDHYNNSIDKINGKCTYTKAVAG